MFFRLPDVDGLYPSATDASSAMTKFQLADSAAVLTEVFGDPADPRIVAAMKAANELDLVVFIPVYGLFLLMAGPLVIGRLDDRLARTRVIGPLRLEQRQDVLGAIGRPHRQAPVVRVGQRPAPPDGDESRVADLREDHA